MLYVHVCCEGWVRLGPFDWVGVDDERDALVDENGEVIVKREGDDWGVPGKEYRGFRFRTPMITGSRQHPSPMRGGFPFTEKR